MHRLLILAAISLVSNYALAFQLECNGITAGSNLRVTYDDAAGTLMQEHLDAAAEEGTTLPKLLTQDTSFSKAGRGIVQLKDTSGTSLMKLKVAGHPLRAQISYLSDKNVETPCSVATGDLRMLFEALIDNPKTLGAIKAWRDWKAARPGACDPEMDSLGYFQPGAANLTAIVFHGYSSSPARMIPVIQALLDQGFNVLAPRLSHHFNVNVRDLDNAKYKDWFADADGAFKVAKQFSNHVALAGFSLGGILASKLAIENPDDVSRLLLFAPAWRVNSMVDLAVQLLSPFLPSSLNEYRGTPIGCKVNEAYASTKGGRQIEMLLSNLEGKYEGAYPNSFPTAFSRIETPTTLFTTPKDEAIRVDQVTEICEQRKIVCNHVNVPGLTHVTMIDDLNVKTDDGKTSMADIIANALAH